MNRAICSGKIQIKGIDFKVLSDDEISDIHYASLEILEKTGVYVEDDDAIDLFHSIGCRVDNDKRNSQNPSLPCRKIHTNSTVQNCAGGTQP